MNHLKPVLTVLLISLTGILFAQNPVKLRRADCFFGIHFDLHASEDIMNAGESLTEEMVDTFLTKVRPDFIQIDCKGHPGISSYPTKVGYHVKGFQKDPLKLWRAETEKNKVGLFMHYSGVWDGKAAVEHPDWAIIKANGERSTQKMSFFSPYLDKLMIPQLKELSRDYRVDGAWIDGECWAVEPDYSLEALKAWKQESDLTDVPRTSEDRYYPQYLEFTRSLFREHLRKYIDAIHQFDPDFQITSNWAYSSMMPEPVSVNVDFISGDVTPQNGVYRSAFESRCIAPQGKPWDLMAWGFSWNGANMPMSIKSAVQLKQEAAQIMAMGGGVQFYYQQNRDLSLKPYLADILKELGSFCRERQKYCHKASPIPQIALLYPGQDYQNRSKSAFSGPTDQLQATLYALLDNQLPVEVLMEHLLAGKMNRYSLIVIPECNYLGPSIMIELRSYLEQGGRILVIGAKTAALFADELGIQSSKFTNEKTSFISTSGHLGGIRSARLEVELNPDAQVLNHFYKSSDYRDRDQTISSSMRLVGKGKIAAIYFDAGTAYSQYKTPVIRDFLAETIASLAPERMIELSGSHLVHLALNKLNGKTMINLINVAGEHTNQAAIAYDEVPALHNLVLSIKTKEKPVKITLYPEGLELPVTLTDGKSQVTIPRLDIHSILEIE
jgi:hypothetical protein